ncbi:MAG: family transcriptional regulator, regulator of embCAB operon, partial [Mycobacterium sp.]|nr:family transcriptional regulator, regulator of embCAB operon [Mycobacterium sp.]
ALAEAEIACGRADAVIPRLEVLSVVIDTGGSFVTSDLRWTNGVQVQGRRIRSSATLADGDHIRIGGHEFTFDIRPR